jgi:hypothetical protein
MRTEHAGARHGLEQGNEQGAGRGLGTGLGHGLVLLCGNQLDTWRLHLGCGEPLRPSLANRARAERPTAPAGTIADARRLSAPWRAQPERRR